MRTEERGATKRAERTCACEFHKMKRHEPHKIAYGVVHDYSATPPGGWTPLMTAAEKRARNAFEARQPEPLRFGGYPVPENGPYPSRHINTLSSYQRNLILDYVGAPDAGYLIQGDLYVQYNAAQARRVQAEYARPTVVPRFPRFTSDGAAVGYPGDLFEGQEVVDPQVEAYEHMVNVSAARVAASIALPTAAEDPYELQRQAGEWVPASAIDDNAYGDIMPPPTSALDLPRPHPDDLIEDELTPEPVEDPMGGWTIVQGNRYDPRPPRIVATPDLYFMGVELETMVQPMPECDIEYPPEPLYSDFVNAARSAAAGGPTSQRASMAVRVAAENEWDRAYSEWSRETRQLRREWEESQAVVTAAQATTMKRPRGLWLAKHDGSVTGPEFASQPATLEYWKSRRRSLEAMFTTLLHAGLRSHEGDACGMHVNISTQAFSDADHLFRFATLVHSNKSWSRRMAQRTVHSTNHWARLDQETFTVESYRKDWARNVMRDGCADNDRYSALNGQNTDRIEFRLPRGTLRLDRFYKNLEWTHAMVEYSRTHDIDEMHPFRFMTLVVAEQRAMYPNLANFIEEKFSSSLLVTGKAA